MTVIDALTVLSYELQEILKQAPPHLTEQDRSNLTMTMLAQLFAEDPEFMYMMFQKAGMIDNPPDELITTLLEGLHHAYEHV